MKQVLVCCLLLFASCALTLDEAFQDEAFQESGVSQCNPMTCSPGVLGNIFCQGVQGCGAGAVCLSRETREGSQTGRCFVQNTHEPIAPEEQQPLPDSCSPGLLCNPWSNGDVYCTQVVCHGSPAQCLPTGPGGAGTCTTFWTP
jgi:hypothetical protein